MLLAEFSFLGLNWTTIVVHMVVFAVLTVGLTFLVYKPVLKFVRKRQESIQKGLDDAQATQEQGEALKAEYESKLQSAQTEADALVAEAEKKSAILVEQAISQAKKESESILQSARDAAEKERQATLEQTKQDLGEVAVSLVRDILQREVTPKDNEELIAESLAAWSKHE